MNDSARNPPNDVAVVGCIGIDTNVYLPGRDIDFAVESNFTENIDYLGQAGGYASLGYSRLGWCTAFIGHVGDDPNGRRIREELADHGIDTRALFHDPRGTCRSVNIMHADGRRKNFYDGKGHMELHPDRGACRVVMRGARLAHFNIPNWGRELLPVARAEGLTLACDLQDLVDLDDPYRRDFLDAADILFFSAANHGDPQAIMRRMLARNPRQIVVSGMGARGCALGTAHGIRTFEPVDLDAPVVDTNGAGDGLAVGFLSSFVLERRSLEDAILRGQIVARHTCAQRASTASLMTREQLEKAHAEAEGKAAGPA
jgi:sugar/nucleoside kinase (ribokinase family)